MKTTETPYTTDRRVRIAQIHAWAEAAQRPLNTSEMDEIDRLSEEMRAEAKQWLDQTLHITGKTDVLRDYASRNNAGSQIAA